jgi:arylsulfatase A-like enzyme
MPDRPNFIIIYTDDQGYGDLSCVGPTDVRTPHLDALAASGVRFTDWYSNCPVCSPSRASLLTGQYPARAGVRSILSGKRDTEGLPAGKPTLAGALRQHGYQTALFGKWHLGVAEPSQPQHFGFDEWFGFLAGCIDYYSHLFTYEQGRGVNPIHDLWENGREVWANGRYMTEMITERALEFLDRADQPFFLYLPYNAPHYPMHAPADVVRRFDHLPWDRRIMAAMIACVDDGVGEIVSRLESLGLRDNTCLFFSSDNGPSRESRNWLDGTPDHYYGGTTGGLRGHKGSLFEGGIREPALLSWPAGLDRGSPEPHVCREVGAMMDVMPTVLALAGVDPAPYDLDGANVLSMIADGAPTPHERLFWEYGKQTAVRQGDYKLVLSGYEVEAGEPQPPHLANLAEDRAEQHNRYDDEPSIAEELAQAATAWREQVEAKWASR